MTKLTALLLAGLTTTVLSLEPVPFTINTKKWSHVLDDHFISITVNPTDLLQGKVYGLQMNSTMAILKGLAPAYVRIGSADTAKYTFKRSRYPSDVVKPDDEYTVTETHWMVFNEVAQQAGLDVIVCLNAAHRSEGTKKWDSRNSLELISFSDSQGYNLTWQLGYEVQSGDDISGLQFGKDLNRLRTILNAFPRYQHAKLIGPDIRVLHKKEDVDFWNDLLNEAGPTLDAVTWHPRWPQPSKMKVSDNSDLGYEFPADYLEWDRVQLGKILQKSIFKNPVWIGETKRESTGTFAEGLIWARRLVLAAKLGIEIVMKQPNLMDVTHPKPEYWIALLHKRLLGKSVLETKNVGNNTDLTVISHCTNPYYWSDKPEKLQDGSVTVYAVNMGGLEQKIQIKGTWTGKSQLVFQYVLTSGSDPDSVFSQMTYLNGEPLMMTDDGLLPDIIPKIKKLERGLTMKLPPYSVGYWVVPEAKVKICQIQQQNIPTINIETLTPSNAVKSPQKTFENIRDINQFIVEKLKNPESESEEVPELKIELVSSESSEKDISMISAENNLPRVARRTREVPPMNELNQQIKTIMQETREFLSSSKDPATLPKLTKASRTMQDRIQGLAEGISDAIKFTNQEQEFNKFLEDSGLKQDFGSLIIHDRRMKPFFHGRNPEGRLDEYEVKERLRRSISESEEFSQESIEDEEEPAAKFDEIAGQDDEEKKNQKQDLVIPHQPDLKGLEERYKQIVHIKLQDGKRKIDDIIRKRKQNETEISQKIKPTETVNDIQEEIIKKEIELLEKTEETVADILKSQKKRQETFEDIIFDELNDVKGERIRELKEMHRSQRKKENAIVKRQAQTPLSKPLLKTVEYIEKNFNLEPESVRKIKRSLEERMGEMLRNYDTRKTVEVKKRLAPSKDERKVTLRKSVRETDRKSERSETKTKPRQEDPGDVQRPKEKNVTRKTTSQTHHKTSKKTEEPPTRRKSEEVQKTTHSGSKSGRPEYEDDSFELFNGKKMEEPMSKSERRRTEEPSEGKKTQKKTKTISKEDTKSPTEVETKPEVEEEEEDQSNKHQETESAIQPSPLKNNKQRREQMLEQISLMVDKMNSKDSHIAKIIKEDDDISVEFESDRRPRGVKRRPRKAEMTVEEIETPEEIPANDKLSKLSKLRKLRARPNRKQKKAFGEDGEETPQWKRHLERVEFDRKKHPKLKFRKLNPKLNSHGNELLTGDIPEILEIPIQQVPEGEKMIPGLPETTTPPVVLNPNKELKKDLEEIAEEKVFLERDSEPSRETLGKNGGEFFTPRETEEIIEGYTVVQPTEEIDVEATTDHPVGEDLENESEKLTGGESESKKKDVSLLETSEDDVPKDSSDVVSMTRIKNLETEQKSSEETENDSAEFKMENSFEILEGGKENGQRKRRATFLPNHGEDDEEDYSSEERIQKFKQMVYRKSPTKKSPTKNEVRKIGDIGMGANEFLRMAGSTVRVMFDDVIPEAYGQTKNKIQNMGISEYIKEFGNIVQQMKNLDQIFLNIGEAAVKGYIRGNKAEKGPYIQVISRKKRGIKPPETTAPKPDASFDYGTTSTEEAITSRENVGEVSVPGWEFGKNLYEDDKTGVDLITEVANPETEQNEKKMETAEVPVVSTSEPPQEPKNPETPVQKAITPKKIVPDDLQEKIFTPWIKTTKDFIQQALTTLQRQRELSEILANDLMRRETTRRAIGKRDTGDEEPKLPVYHMIPPAATRKRETQQKHTDESLIRHLRGLQPGVYVVPTEEMTNIRSEQITNEAKQKSGLPNVVTLNIYYDKKTADGKTDAGEPKITQDAVTYYQNKAWNTAAGQYDQSNQYTSDLSTPGLATQAVFAAEPRVAELPNSRLIQYPTPTYHYPPIQKMYPAIVPNPQSVYGPVYYLPQETRYASQSPGTKRQWREFKARSAGVPLNSGWNVQYDVPASVRGPPKTIFPSSYNKDYKFLIQDKKRSIGDLKADPTWSETALPFWKFFSMSEKNKNPETVESAEKTEKISVEIESSEDMFAENRKRAKAAVEKKVKTNSVEQVTEEQIPEEVEEAENAAEEEKPREKRSIQENDLPRETRKLVKRSDVYDVGFRDHNILPEWFGTYREVENGLEGFPPHVRRSHIVSSQWSDEDEELLKILQADDELSLVDLDDDDDYYYSNDNMIQHLRRYPRSTDQFESNMIKTNMIYKMPMDGDHLKPKSLGMTGIKKLTDEDSSLEMVTKSKSVEMKTAGDPKPKELEDNKPKQSENKAPEGSENNKPQELDNNKPKEQQQEIKQQTSIQWPLLTTAQPSLNESRPSLNVTNLLLRNPQDETLYYFFKYAYDSFVRVMRSMTEFF